MSNRLLKLLPILLAFFVICSVSAFAVFADESSEAVSDEASTEASEETSADESEETSAAESGDESEEASAATSSTASAATSSADSHDHDHEEEEDESTGLSAQTWQLIITLGVIVILVAVLFILAKTNSKAGQKISKFFKDYKSELGKVVWMPRKDLLKSTGIVLVVLVCACILIGLLDVGFSALLNLISSIG